MPPKLQIPIAEFSRITTRQLAALKKLGIQTLRDLLFHFPARYEKIGALKTISELKPGEKAAVVAEVVEIKPEKTWKKKMRLAEGLIRDSSGLLRVVWFNQPYVANILKLGMRAKFYGKISQDKSGRLMANPLYEAQSGDAPGLEPTRELMPMYPETYGLTSRWFRTQIARAFQQLGTLPEPLSKEVLEKYHLPSFVRALKAIHFPKNLGEAEASRKRFAFEEIFYIQLNRQRERKKLEAQKPFIIETHTELLKRFVDSLPFTLTQAQRKAVWQIVQDFKKPHPMARLLEGDVGSGKTVVAAAAALNVVAAGFQTAYLAPTEILCRQHFEEFIKRLGPFKIRIGLLTGSEARKFPSKVNPKTSAHVSKNQMLRWCLSGEIQILIGTHALIEERVKFKKLALVIVDEQHRFGVAQRRSAVKGLTPHFLSMSATPIPRTLALTIYGDLDLTLLDEMPAGREAVDTKVIGSRGREKIYNFIREEVKTGGQVFVICPRIEENRDANIRMPTNDTNLFHRRTQQKLMWSEVKSVKAEYKKLSEEIFPDLRVGMIHGKLKPRDKETVMNKFKHHELDILVSTSVVEVGVDIHNASIMVIEGGERFGLAQLHQFRGRVGRGNRKSYCFVFTTTTDHINSQRLQALQKAKSGFELAEYDLQFRGPGELSGRKQWGISDVGMEALKNLKMVEAARLEARVLVEKDPELKNRPLLKERIQQIETAFHFE